MDPIVALPPPPRSATSSRILLIDDEVDVQYSFRRILNAPGIELLTASSGEEGLKMISANRPDLVVMDVRLGGMNGLETLKRLREIDQKLPVIMMTAYGTTQTAIEAMKLGAYDYLLKPFDIPRMKNLIAEALKVSRDMSTLVSYQPLLESEDYDLGIVGRSDSMQQVFKMIGQLATSDATALITGESGTGKELVAKAIYQHSRRSSRSFLAINCAAIPEQLLESELFGHEKGAFTGASATRIGKFQHCDHGTIFLDEIGEMKLSTQSKILRVLQDGTFERVGGNEPIKVDVRLIAATNKQLEKAVMSGEFREDLFYRLNVVRLQIPPLRERSEDTLILVHYFLKKWAKAERQKIKSISSEAISLLQAYHWPGNVRELENAIHRALVVAKGEIVGVADLPQEVINATRRRTLAATTGDGAQPEGRSLDLETVGRWLFEQARADKTFKVIPAVERALIIQALAESGGNQVQAAKILGITRATLRKRVEKFQIKKELSIT